MKEASPAGRVIADPPEPKRPSAAAVFDHLDSVEWADVMRFWTRGKIEHHDARMVAYAILTGAELIAQAVRGG